MSTMSDEKSLFEQYAQALDEDPEFLPDRPTDPDSNETNRRRIISRDPRWTRPWDPGLI